MSVFQGRSLTVVEDFSIDEQVYLYEQTRELKEALRKGGDISRFKIGDVDLGIYLIFLENSTRTRESFANAAKFHGAKVNLFNTATSSFNKNESITDTIKMLFGYSERSLFIIRSKQEGLCRWLHDALGTYADRIGMPRPGFINAGDGKHEHPTQEFLDEFSFLEQRNWNRDKLRIALVGDLFHGRTVHSKVNGLKIFNEVEVDLVAPEELAMPAYYTDRMRENGFKVNIFESIESYIDSGGTAPIWYFTRPQLERMGDEILEKADSLRDAITFKQEFIERISPETRFYHPLPRHREHPTIPAFLDNTPFNAWDEQSVNGYFTRIIEIALLSGGLGTGFEGAPRKETEDSEDFVEEVPVASTESKPEYKVGIKPVERGTVIDHIGRGRDLKLIWDHIDKIRQIMGFNIRSSHGVYHSSSDEIFKGIISLPDVVSLNESQLKMLSAIAPGCTLNIIENSRVKKKYRLHMPPKVYGFKEISCKNENCISRPELFEHVQPEFIRSAGNRFTCRYCEHSHSFHDIWDV